MEKSSGSNGFPVNVKGFELSGEGGIKITYPPLAYKDEEFEGKNFIKQDTPLGSLVSIVLDEEADGRKVMFSLIIPIANVPKTERSIPIDTYAIRTNEKSSIAGTDAIKGQVQTYEILAMRGNAWTSGTDSQ